MEKTKIQVWKSGDWNGFFGLFVNNLTNALVMASLLTVSVGLPMELVYGKIMPAVGIALLASSGYYFFMAYRLAKKEDRNTVTAMPSGISVPHMFLIVFMIIAPVYAKTQDPILAWTAGVCWTFIEGLVEISGAFFGRRLQKLIPRVAMLGALAGVSITFIALSPAFDIWAAPYVGIVSLTIVLLGLVGKVKMPFNMPTGLVALLAGTVIGYFGGLVDFGAAVEASKNVSLSLPEFSIMRIVNGLPDIIPFIIVAIPLGIYNFFETLDNIESASVAGDHYNIQEAMFVDGTTTILGSLFGNPFPTAIYLGHPGWKESGAGLGYALATGASMFVLTSFGLIGVLLEIIPVAAILPILLYIGIMIGSQVFSSVEAKYFPAGIIALIPWLADWSSNVCGIALSSAGTTAETVGYNVITNNGINYIGMEALGAGAILTSMILASLTVFIIDHSFKKATVVTLIACVLSFFGIIHSASIGILANKEAFIGYLISSLLLLYLHFRHSKEELLNEK